ncbi:hypothetical protein G4228_003524 [Cervus hanglu yarkandensis]|nr:hypothetical protein G4228_003524 [Cervus hanglu yarkandensis]
MAWQGLATEFLQVPAVTRTYTAACVLTTAAVVWRLITNFLFFGPLGFSFFFNMLFVYPAPWWRRERGQGGYRAGGSGPGDAEPLQGARFLYQSRRFRYCRMLEEGSFRGRTADFVFMFLFGGLLMTGIGHPCSGGFRAVEGGLGIGGSPTGIVVGHVYYFLEDVFPNQPGGKRLLLTPSFLKLLLDAPEEDPNYRPLPEEQPGPVQQ